jgi:hypothetical protein
MPSSIVQQQNHGCQHECKRLLPFDAVYKLTDKFMASMQWPMQSQPQAWKEPIIRARNEWRWDHCNMHLIQPQLPSNTGKVASTTQLRLWATSIASRAIHVHLMPQTGGSTEAPSLATIQACSFLLQCRLGCCCLQHPPLRCNVVTDMVPIHLRRQHGMHVPLTSYSKSGER